MGGKVDETKWRMVRLRLDTISALRRVELLIRKGYEQGLNDIGPDERDRLSVDQIIKELLRRDEDHRQRAKRSGTKRRAQAIEQAMEVNSDDFQGKVEEHVYMQSDTQEEKAKED